nr:putative reverse transcriptase domain-containing protein [Tanacetum cinerariifolium]
MDNPNSPNEPNKDIPKENLVIPEPNHVEDAYDPNEMVDILDDEDLVDHDVDDEEPEEETEQQIGHRNQFAQHPNPQLGNMNGWLEEDDGVKENVNNEDIEDEDVEVEVDDEAELLFPRTKRLILHLRPLLGLAQRPFAIRDFPRGIVEVGESFAAHDSSYVGGLEPWALRRDLETSCALARLTEAELSTTQAKIALLKSKNKIREKERKLLDHDLGDVERTLNIVLERLKVLESGENATLKRKLAEKEMQLVIARMDHANAERRLNESIGWNRRIMPPKAMSEAQMHKIIRDQVAASMAGFMANMNRGISDAGTDGAEAGGAGTGGAETGGAGTRGAETSGAGTGGAEAGGAEAGGAGLVVPEITSDCKEKDKVKFAIATLQGRALTWWNGRIASMGIDAANGTSWTEVRKWMTEEFCPEVKVEQYICRLSKNIRGDVTSSSPASINEAVCMAYQLMGHIIQDKTDETPGGEKQKGEGDRGGCGDNRLCPNCKNKKHAGDCWKCGKDCPKLKKNGQGGNNHGAVYKLGAMDVQQDPKVITGTFLLNNRYATTLFDSGADKSFMSTKFSTLIDIEPVKLDTFCDVELADGKVVSTNNVLIWCTLNLLNHSFPIDLMVIEQGSFDIIIGMDWLSRYDAVILCGKRKVRIPLEGKTLVIEGNRNNSRLKIVSCIKARKYIKNGCELFLAQVTKKGLEEKRLEDVPVIRDFPEVFLDELPGLPPPRQVEFRIDLIPGAASVARTPYRLAPSKMKELSEQLREFSENGFIRPSSSPWGALKNKLYMWGDDEEEAFQILKLKLCSAPILSLPEGSEDFVVYCNASLKGFGAVLMQREKEIAGWDKHLPLAEFSYNNSYYASIKAAPFEALYGRKCRSHVCWSEVGDAQLTRPKMIREMTEMIVQIKNWLLAARSRQKSYADVRRKPLEFEVGDKVMLKVSPWKGVIRFRKRGKLSPRYIRPFKILSRKCLSDEDLIIPLDKVKIDEKLHFIEEPFEIMDREEKQLKQSRIPIVKVRWNSRRGPEYTWEREDQM